MLSSHAHRSTLISLVGLLALGGFAACTTVDVGDDAVGEAVPVNVAADLDRTAALQLVTSDAHAAGLRMVATDAQVPVRPRVAVDERPAISVRPNAPVPDAECGCEVFDFVLDAPLRRAVGVTWRDDSAITPVTIGPVVAVFGDSITHGEGSPGPSWVEQLAALNPDLEVRNLARFGMTLYSWPWNNMVAHTAEDGPGRAQLDGVDTVIYVSAFNDFHHIGGEVDVIVQGLHQVFANLEAAPIENFFLLPMLPVGERWAVRAGDPGPGGPIMDWIDEFNLRVVADGVAVPFDPGFDRDGDPTGYGDPEMYDGFRNSDPTFDANDGVDGVHPGPLGHQVLAERVDELLRVASTVGVPNVGRGTGGDDSSLRDG